MIVFCRLSIFSVKVILLGLFWQEWNFCIVLYDFAKEFECLMLNIVLNPDYGHLRAWIEKLPSIFDDDGDLIYCGRNIVKKFVVEGQAVIVKKFKIPNLAQRIAYTFWRKSKAMRAYLYAGRLIGMGIDTPKGIACLECSSGCLFSTGFFVSEECTHPSVASVMVDSSSITEMSACLGRFIADMHRKGFLHGDLNLSNILCYRTSSGDVDFAVIDTNRSVFVDSPSRKACLDNMKRISHDRELLEKIVRAYAIERQWDVQECVGEVMKALSEFEHLKRMRRKFKQCSK